MLRSPSGRPTISAAPTPTWNGCSAEPSSMPAGSHPSRARPWGSSQTPPTKPRKTPPTRARTNHPERQWRRHEGHQLARHRRRYRSSLRATDLPAFPRRPRRRHRRRHHLPAVRLLGLRQPNPNDRTANVLGNDHLRQTTRTPRNRFLTARESNHPTRNPFMYWHSRRTTEHSRNPRCADLRPVVLDRAPRPVVETQLAGIPTDLPSHEGNRLVEELAATAREPAPSSARQAHRDPTNAPWPDIMAQPAPGTRISPTQRRTGRDQTDHPRGGWQHVPNTAVVDRVQRCCDLRR